MAGLTPASLVIAAQACLAVATLFFLAHAGLAARGHGGLPLFLSRRNPASRIKRMVAITLGLVLAAVSAVLALAWGLMAHGRLAGREPLALVISAALLALSLLALSWLRARAVLPPPAAAPEPVDSETRIWRRGTARVAARQVPVPDYDPPPVPVAAPQMEPPAMSPIEPPPKPVAEPVAEPAPQFVPQFASGFPEDTHAPPRQGGGLPFLPFATRHQEQATRTRARARREEAAEMSGQDQGPYGAFVPPPEPPPEPPPAPPLAQPAPPSAAEMTLAGAVDALMPRYQLAGWVAVSGGQPDLVDIIALFDGAEIGRTVPRATTAEGTGAAARFSMQVNTPLRHRDLVDGTVTIQARMPGVASVILPPGEPLLRLAAIAAMLSTLAEAVGGLEPATLGEMLQALVRTGEIDEQTARGGLELQAMLHPPASL